MSFTDEPAQQQLGRVVVVPGQPAVTGVVTGISVALFRIVCSSSVHTFACSWAQVTSPVHEVLVPVARSAMPAQSWSVVAFSAKFYTTFHASACEAASSWFAAQVACVEAATSAALFQASRASSAALTLAASAAFS